MEQSLVGIRGWLIFPAIGLVLRLIVTPIALIEGLASIPRLAKNGAVGILLYWALAMLAIAGLYIYSWVAAVRFFDKRASAPQTMIRLLIAKLLAAVVLFVVGLAVFGGNGAQALTIVEKGIAAAIWISYYQVSKRVKATFVN